MMRIAQVAPLFESVPPEDVRRHRARRVVPHRSAGRTGPRGDAVCERRLGDVGAVATGDRTQPAPGPAPPRLDHLAHADDRSGVRRCRRTTTSSISTPTRCTCRSRVRAGGAACRRCTAGSTCPTWCRCSSASTIIHWCRSPTTSASRCHGRTGAAPCTTGCRASCTASTPCRRTTSLSSAASRRRSASIVRSKSPSNATCR